MIPEFPVLTDSVVAELVAAGRYWWLRDGEYVASDDRIPLQENDIYILETSPQWLATFGSNQELADLINDVIAQNVAAMAQSSTDGQEN